MMQSAGESTVFSRNKTLNVGGTLLDLSSPKVMGILNVTPDSFYDGGRFNSTKALLTQAGKLLEEGASIIDIGGYSTRPGADDVPLEEELQRVIFAVQAIRREFPQAIISVDTFRSAVVRAGVQEGASMVNDISGGAFDEEMFRTIAELNIPYTLMHIRGTPQTMTGLSQYQNVTREVIDEMNPKIFQLRQMGVTDVIIDPGFGFAKNIDQNFELLNHLDDLKIFGNPIMVGLSRKSMIWRTLALSPDRALNGTTVLHTVAVLKGANILRAHDVREAIEVLKLIEQFRR